MNSFMFLSGVVTGIMFTLATAVWYGSNMEDGDE